MIFSHSPSIPRGMTEILLWVESNQEISTTGRNRVAYLFAFPGGLYMLVGISKSKKLCLVTVCGRGRVQA